MKTAIRLFALLIVPLIGLQAAEDSYWWNPTGLTGSGNVDSMGGSGNWLQASTFWWNGSTNVAKGAGNTNRFGNNTTNTGSILNFNGLGGVVTLGNSMFFAINGTAGTIVSHTFNFANNSNYTLTNSGAYRAIVAGIASNETVGGNALFTFNVGQSASLNVGGLNATAHLAILGGLNISGGGSIVFSGNGNSTVNFNNYSLLRIDGPNGRFLFNNGITANFNTGSVLTGNRAAYADPFTTNGNNGTRIGVNNATMNIDGATLNVAYRGSAAANILAGYGILIGNDTSGQGTVNFKSGTIKALGDPRYTDTTHANYTQFGGIGFGSNNTSGSGGSFNMTGGSLVTSGIRGSSNATSILTFNGGIVTVSTEIASEAGGAITNAQLQTRLDNFITGFANNATSYVALGNNGTTIDTSGIDTGTTDGTATISSAMRNIAGQNGTFTKNGTGTVRLTAINTYTGNTTVNQGTLINEGKISGATYVADGATLAGNGTFADINFLGSNATLEASVGLVAENVHFISTLNITLDLSTITDASSTAITFSSLTAEGSTVNLILTGTSSIDLIGYTLFDFGTTTLDTDSEILITGLPPELQQYTIVDGKIVLGIPEPSTYALIAALAILTLAITHRRK